MSTPDTVAAEPEAGAGTPGDHPPRRVVVMGAGGRDFHDFNTVFRDDPTSEVVAFTAAQIPGIDDRRYPAELAGRLYPDGIPIVPEAGLADLIGRERVDEVVLSYSDLAHVDVMHRASLVLAAGADFRLLGPRATMLDSSVPVIAVGATRTGCGKSQTTRAVVRMLVAEGRRVVVVRHPMPYGDLGSMVVQRFASLADIDAAHPTIEEREEYEAAVALGVVLYAGVDYQAILRAAEAEADVIIWDGGNNDMPFFRPDLMVTVADALRPGDGMTHHPGEANLRLADVVVVNKVDSADADDVARVIDDVRAINPEAQVVRTRSPVTLDAGPPLDGARVLVIEDGPTITHGGMPFGAGTVAARRAGAAEVVDPRASAVGSIAETFARYPHIGAVLPAMGYGDDQLAELAATIAATDCDVVVVGTPVDLARLVAIPHPVRRARYESADAGSPTFAEVLTPHFRRWWPERGRG
ncbi:MAG TPA: cyclic 2,3-diphosphoglycerate synthase [Acidimicrobiales bacterium]